MTMVSFNYIYKLVLPIIYRIQVILEKADLWQMKCHFKFDSGL